MINSVLHKANTRGGADMGWLNAKHSFSFSNYYDPKRMNFGVLRVLNDDIIGADLGDFYIDKNKKTTENIEPIWKEFYEKNKDGHNLKTLLNYAKIVAKSNNLNYSEYELCLILTNIDIPKFKDRNDTTLKRQEKITFKTPFAKII